MTAAEVVPWLAVVIALANLAYTVIAGRQKANLSKVRDMDARINTKADAAAVAVLATKVDVVEDRITRVETDFKHLPSIEVTHRLEVELGALRADVQVLSERLKPVSAIASRLQDEMLERAGS